MTMPAEKDSLRHFFGTIFSGRPPPEDPFAQHEWNGVAFDRNRYEQLAPLVWWDALIACSSTFLGEHEVFAIEKTALLSLGADGILTIANSKESIFEYFDRGENFLRDQYLIGKNLRWACCLDQDVSLFGGDKGFMQECFNKAGGRQYLHAKMRDDFIGEIDFSANPSDEFVLNFESYFERLLGS